MSKNMIWFILFIYLAISNTAKDRYISMERPVITYINSKYFSYANITTTRYGRQNPFYYVDMHFETVMGFNNNVTVFYYFYEYISNMQLSKFFEMHYKLCDLIHKDPLLGPIVKQGKLKQPCPYPAGDYHLYNLTMPVEIIPKSLPFTKGRIVSEIRFTATKEMAVTGHIDMEIKLLRNRRNKG